MQPTEKFCKTQDTLLPSMQRKCAESVFEKYRVIQDRLFRSDFDKFDDEDPQLPLDIE